MSTFDKHRALLLEIIAEMSPEELDEALKPVDWEAEFRAMPIELEPGPEQISPDLLFGPAITYNPNAITASL